MSDNENNPPAPSKQTSSVPLKKETVRVTLKAADAPPATPSATTPAVKPPVPPTAGGGAPKPPAATAPTAAAPPRPTASAPAPTIPLKTAGPAAPAPTIKLATSTAPVGAPTVPLKTASATASLPKATVQLQPPTQPIGSASASQAPTLAIQEEDDEEAGSGLLNGLAIVGFAAACAVLAIQLMISNIWINAADNESLSGWMQLLE
jgi:hypothetical protein